MAIRAIAFDLDDTLLDTSGKLSPQAAQNAFQILIDAGLKLTLAECEQKRTEMIRTISHKEVFEKLAQDFGTSTTQAATAHATKAFYEPDVPEQLHLLAGALENLEYLSQNYALYLVTAGNADAQKQKIAALRIGHYFKKIFIVNSLIKERKIHSFKKILDIENIDASQLLCVGNSLSSEIADAVQLKAKSCFFDFGEDRGQVEQLEKLKPDFHVTEHKELIGVCQL